MTLTYPHIGNTGVNPEDEESSAIQAAGLVIRDLPPLASNWRQRGCLDDYLLRQGVPGIADIDTRRLTRVLREKGAQNGCLQAGEGIGRGGGPGGGPDLCRPQGHGPGPGGDDGQGLWMGSGCLEPGGGGDDREPGPGRLPFYGRRL